MTPDMTQERLAGMNMSVKNLPHPRLSKSSRRVRSAELTASVRAMDMYSVPQSVHGASGVNIGQELPAGIE